MTDGALTAALLTAALLAAAWCSWRSREPEDPTSRRRETYLTPIFYAPKCDPTRHGDTRPECRGLTGGVPPAIEDGRDGAWLCPGRLGVPPGYPIG
jgi:hypothetical protein